MFYLLGDYLGASLESKRPQTPEDPTPRLFYRKKTNPRGLLRNAAGGRWLWVLLFRISSSQGKVLKSPVGGGLCAAPYPTLPHSTAGPAGTPVPTL